MQKSKKDEKNIFFAYIKWDFNLTSRDCPLPRYKPFASFIWMDWTIT